MTHDIGMAIRESRQLRRKTQAEVATAVGVTRGSISQWEAGISRPSFANLQALAEFLEIDPGALVNGQVSLADDDGSSFGQPSATTVALLVQAAEKEIGFTPTPDQAFMWLAKKAGLHETIFPATPTKKA